MGFSVTGRVLNSVGGEGVPDATVSLNNQIKGNHTKRAHTLVVVSWNQQEKKTSNCRNALSIHFHTVAYFAILFSQSSARRMDLSGWRTWQLVPTPSASTRSSCFLSQSQWRSPPTHLNFLTSSQQGKSGLSAHCLSCKQFHEDTKFLH